MTMASIASSNVDRDVRTISKVRAADNVRSTKEKAWLTLCDTVELKLDSHELTSRTQISHSRLRLLLHDLYVLLRPNGKSQSFVPP